jgi:plastocyanin
MSTSSFVRPTLVVVACALGALLTVGCGSSSTGVMTGPTPGPVPGGSANVTIAIVGMNGSQSFSPNPAAVTQGQTVAFKNNDSTTHHIVQDGGGFNTGDLAPGATSAPIAIGTAGALSYHCTIHPTMVGVINGASAGGSGGSGY